MLRYASVGERSYGEKPWHPHTRYSWEFQAVLEGECALWLPARKERRSRTLWLAAPECVHGWAAEAGTTCRVCVFHFPDVPDLLRVLVGERGHAEVALDEAAGDRLEVLAQRAVALLPSDPLSGIRSDAILAELSLLVAERLPVEQVRRFTAPSDPARLVADAMAWYAGNLAARPGVAEMAQAMRVSTAHLRRLFVSVRGAPPLAAMGEIRLRRAEDLMRDRTLTLDEVARRSGYADASSLSHAYHAARGVPPGRVAGRRRG
ncbi:MAG: helix-turn-helix transcriptional regulator [Planctomycetes bacterium]|nr:helix-turn-helix transcriptional regulator [Planctomycetota bacterium]